MRIRGETCALEVISRARARMVFERLPMNFPFNLMEALATQQVRR